MSKKILLKETLKGAAKGALKSGLMAAAAGGTAEHIRGMGRVDSADYIRGRFASGVAIPGEAWKNINVDPEQRRQVHDYLEKNTENERVAAKENSKNAVKVLGVLGAAYGALKGGRKSYKETKERLKNESDNANANIKIARLIINKGR